MRISLSLATMIAVAAPVAAQQAAPIERVDLPPSTVADEPDGDPPAPAPPPAASLDAARSASGDAMAIAQRYLARARDDRADARVWALCAAAAMRRASASGPVADGYARETAATMRSLVAGTIETPCADAIPGALWNDTTATDALPPEEVERQRRLNVAADAQEQAIAARQAAAERLRDEREATYREGQRRYEADRAAYEAAAARAAEADAAYRAEMARPR